MAKEYNIPLKVSIRPKDDKLWEKVKKLEECFEEEGLLVNSEQFNGLTSKEAKPKIIEWLVEKGLAKRKVNYHLRDWSISRQRYWGTPVPIIRCDKCGLVPVPEKDLPVELPYNVDYTPQGKPPLATDEEWLNVSCPKCGGKAKRDAETLDTFFDSAWYYYRYVSPSFKDGPFDAEKVKQLMPVDVYFGGSEHTLGHTLYARFFTKFFKDIGLVEFSEFAKKRIQHGVILGPDGNRMSKSKGNVVNPDDVVKEYGADTVRLYLCFMMPYEATAPWSTGAISGIYRFLKRVWDLSEKVHDVQLSQSDLTRMHKTIKKVGDDLNTFQFNTAVAALMTWLNFLSAKEKIAKQEYETLLKLLAPFAPFITEELWQSINPSAKPARNASQREAGGSIHLEEWPVYEQEYLVEDEVSIVVQINGKLRDTVQVQSSKFKVQSEVEELARKSSKIVKYLEGQDIKKVIYVEGRLINFVV
jgi:leucyl-tRNA synthetase